MQNIKMKKPKPLRPNQVIGLISPGSFIRPEQLIEAEANIRSINCIPFHYPSITDKHGNFAGTDAQRMEEFNNMITNPAVDAIMCIRGGYGCTRLLPHINYQQVREFAKPIIGFSDITALHIAFHKFARLVSFHGPVAVAPFNTYTVGEMIKVLNHTNSKLVLSYERDEDTISNPEFDFYTITPGIAEGELIGGNLSLLAALCGTPFEPDFTGKIVFIEEIDEVPYRIDRLITQLTQTETFKKAAGIIFGIFKLCNPDGVKVNSEDSLNLSQIFDELIVPLNIPTVYGFSFGHVKHKCTMPIGINAELNATYKTITLLENTVEPEMV